MSAPRWVALGDELYEALRGRWTVAPLSERFPEFGIDEAWLVSGRLLERRLADGERVVGKKIGVTSEPVQRMLGVFEPDFGWLTDAMRCERDVPASTRMIQPRAEAEIALVLGEDVDEVDATPERLRAATASVHAAIEVVDSRIRDWKIRIADTVADNASSGMLVVGEGCAPGDLDLAAAEVVCHKNGAPLSRGRGALALGSPWRSAAWLARTLAARGERLRAGEIVLTGSLVPLEPVVPGDVIVAVVDGIGRVEARFV